MPTLALVNPASGRNLDRAAVDALLGPEFREAGEEFHTVVTTSPEDWDSRVRSAVDSGYDKILVVGGDGSVHQTIQGLDLENVAMGILPRGSGNDIYRSFGIPIEPKTAIRNFLSGELQVDIGIANGRHFINTVGIGLDSTTLIVRREVTGWRARNYVYLFLKAFSRLQPIDAEFEIDGESVSRKAYWIIAANNIFIGGGMKVAPYASIRDGTLDLVIVGDIPKWVLLTFIPRIFKGTHVNHPKVEVFKCKKLLLKSPVRIPCAIDGEIHGETPLDIQILPGKLRLRGSMSGA